MNIDPLDFITRNLEIAGPRARSTAKSFPSPPK